MLMEDPSEKQHPNPLLDTRLYEVEFPDGSTEAITVNFIAETMWSHVDNKGRSYSVLKEIVDHQTNGRALSKDNGYTVDQSGRRHPKVSTQGWELEVEWRDGMTSWVPLKDLRILTLCLLPSMLLLTKFQRNLRSLGG